MHCLAYSRVSSRAQDLACQRSAIEHAAKLRGDAISSWYEEKRSARTIARPELERLRRDIRSGAIPAGSRLYTFRIDRLSRSGIRDTFEVIEDLRAHGVQLITVADGFSLDGPAAEVVLAVLAWASSMERLAINERISASREQMAQDGKAWGRPPRLTKEDAAKIFRLKEQGRSIRQIAVALKIPKSIVGRALTVSRKVSAENVTRPPVPEGSQQGPSRKRHTGTGGDGETATL